MKKHSKEKYDTLIHLHIYIHTCIGASLIVDAHTCYVRPNDFYELLFIVENVCAYVAYWHANHRLSKRLIHFPAHLFISFFRFWIGYICERT